MIEGHAEHQQQAEQHAPLAAQAVHRLHQREVEERARWRRRRRARRGRRRTPAGAGVDRQGDDDRAEHGDLPLGQVEHPAEAVHQGQADAEQPELQPEDDPVEDRRPHRHGDRPVGAADVAGCAPARRRAGGAGRVRSRARSRDRRGRGPAAPAARRRRSSGRARGGSRARRTPRPPASAPARSSARRASASAARAINARPTASICCSPPLIVPARWRTRSPRRGNRSSTSARRSASGRRGIGAEVEVLARRSSAGNRSTLGGHVGEPAAGDVGAPAVR